MREYGTKWEWFGEGREKKTTTHPKCSSVSNAKLTLRACVFWEWGFWCGCVSFPVMHRNCNNFALFKILSFQGTTSILKKQRDTRQKSSALSCLQSLDMGFGVLFLGRRKCSRLQVDPQLTTGWVGLGASKKIGKFLEAGADRGCGSTWLRLLLLLEGKDPAVPWRHSELGVKAERDETLET